jgi:hypothetical protein
VLANVSRRALLTYAAIVAAQVACKLFFMWGPVAYKLPDQAAAFAWPTLLGMSALGFGALLLGPRAGLPDAWDPSVSNRQRFLVPAIWGVVYGLIAVAHDLPAPRDVHVPFPASIPFYWYGGIFLETLLRLVALTFLCWLIGEILLRGRHRTVAFWIANVAAATYEPLGFLLRRLAEAPPLAAPGLVIDEVFSPLFLGNLLTGYVYRRFGILAAFTLRLSFYAVWHVGYGSLRHVWLPGVPARPFP